ncbi:pimeloyl-ACP methyl ester carboxylesterase [Microbacterium testaceum]|uniref:alpha/beta fold hydrolase n=1 Tax=Microbacterium testaceum TaxID=2033 RepID=UPI00277E6409|nr:alpha/beta hydrolase [Microbacterium testaceum]MDQ1171740.1 pimeloyl-ACP methyl ester carboxylesterase [Microbacterium testaceum]
MPLTPEPAIHYVTDGDTGHPTVVLIAGGGAQLIAWHVDLVAQLVDRGLHVVRIDNRDVGLSARFGGVDDIDGGYGLEEMGDDVVRVLDDLGVARAHLVGHSMGGMMAQMTALRHPDRVASLGLLSTIPGRDPRYVLHAEPDLTAAPARYTRDEVVAGASAFAAATAGQRYPLDVGWNAWAAGEAFDRGYSPEGFSRQWAALMRAPERLELLRDVDVPVLVFHGRDDDVLHWSAAVDMAEALVAAELQVHPGMGHYIVPELWPELIAGIARTVAAGEARH